MRRLGATVGLAFVLGAVAACGASKDPSAFADPDGGGNSGDDDGTGNGGSGGGGDDDGTGFGNAGSDAGKDGSAPDTTVNPTGTPLAIDACSSGSTLSAATVKALQAGGSPGSFRYLYPYDGTVFPRGLIAPTLMWDGATGADGVYVHIKSSLFEYKGCLKPTASGQLLLPQSVWNQAAARTQSGADTFAMDLTVQSGSTVSGPVHESFFIAPATLKGSIFYNSYASKLASGGGAIGGGSGAVLRIVPGQNATVFLGGAGDCIGCHAVSANGKRLIAEPLPGLVGVGGATYAVAQNAPPNPAPLFTATALGAPFAGMFPDGSLYVGNAHQGGVGTRAGAPGAQGLADAALYETDTGTQVQNTGIPAGAMTPTFSPDGTQLAFTDYAIASGKGIATMTFDGKGRKATGYKQLYASGNAKYPAWPFFFPDNSAVVFALGDASDFSGNGLGLGFGGAVAAVGAGGSDVYLVNAKSGTAQMLAKAMGYASLADAQSSKTYLPFGSEELHHNFYPTVSPVAAGGFFWVFFDSYRHYGNQGLQRQLWGTAVNINDGKASVDLSHPPFYVTGQEAGTGNHRAFTALDPCHASGDTCTTGIDCCQAFCTNGKCGAPAPRCSNTDEGCSATQKCCNAADVCIGGFCAAPTIN